MILNYAGAVAYLTRCADDNGNHWYEGRVWSDVETCPTCHGTNDAGHLHTPGSRYGRTAAHCAPVAYQVSRIHGDVSESGLDYVMGLVVNDSPEPAEDIAEYVVGLAGANIGAMVDGYLEAQLWAQSDNDRDDSGNTMLDDNYGIEDIDPEYVARVTAEFTELVTAHPLAVRMFLNAGENPALLTLLGSHHRYRNESFGHDFYLTREGHGAGFWDCGLGELGDYLTTIAESAGSADELWDNGNGVLA